MIKRLIFLFLLGAIGAYFFRTYCYEGIYVASESMEPNFPKDRHVMVNKFAFFFRSPHRGEVIMFDSPENNGKGLIKRVIAVGGDELEIRDKKVYVNGSRQSESYVQYLQPDTMFVGDNIPPITIPKGTLFVMGDNRDVSGDSRDWINAEGKHIPFLSLSKVKGLVQ